MCLLFRICAEKAPFFSAKLKIRCLPTLVFFIDGVSVHSVIGFAELGGTDGFKTAALARLMLKHRVCDNLLRVTCLSFCDSVSLRMPLLLSPSVSLSFPVGIFQLPSPCVLLYPCPFVSVSAPIPPSRDASSSLVVSITLTRPPCLSLPFPICLAPLHSVSTPLSLIPSPCLLIVALCLCLFAVSFPCLPLAKDA